MDKIKSLLSLGCLMMGGVIAQDIMDQVAEQHYLDNPIVVRGVLNSYQPSGASMYFQLQRVDSSSINLVGLDLDGLCIATEFASGSKVEVSMPWLYEQNNRDASVAYQVRCDDIKLQ